MILSFEEGNFSGAMLNLAAVLRNLGVPPKKTMGFLREVESIAREIGSFVSTWHTPKWTWYSKRGIKFL